MTTSVSPYKNDSTGRHWEYSLTFTWPDGTRFPRERRRISSPMSRKQAEAFALEREVSLRRLGKDAWIESLKPPVPTVAEFAAVYIAAGKARRLTAASIANRECKMRCNIVPVLGHLRLDEIGPKEIDDLRLALDRMAATSVRQVLAHLNTMLALAEEREIISKRPKVRLGRAARRQPVWHGRDEFRAMLDAARRLDEAAGPGGRHAMLILLGADAGLRCGEMLALEGRHLDVRRGLVRVEANVWRGIAGLPKGKTAESVEMSAALLAECERLSLPATCRVFERPARVERVARRGRRGPACAGATAGVLKAMLARVLRAAGLPVHQRLHGLRHSFGSRLSEAGVPVRTIMALMRHKTLAMTENYLHSTAGAARAAVASLGDGPETKLRLVQKP